MLLFAVIIVLVMSAGFAVMYRIGRERGLSLGYSRGVRQGIIIGRNRQNVLIASRNPGWLMRARLLTSQDAVDELIEIAESDEP